MKCRVKIDLKFLHKSYGVEKRCCPWNEHAGDVTQCCDLKWRYAAQYKTAEKPNTYREHQDQVVEIGLYATVADILVDVVELDRRQAGHHHGEQWREREKSSVERMDFWKNTDLPYSNST